MTILAQYLPKGALGRLESKKDTVVIDMCSEVENKFMGRPDCIFLSWLDELDWIPHPDAFIIAIKRFGCQLDAEIILVCYSSYRSSDVGYCFINQSFTNMAYIVNGFKFNLDESNQQMWRY
jgi:rhodanese-related sulfurtransferase